MIDSVKLLTTYAKADGGTRYVAVLSDNSIWWYMPNHPWQPSPSIGLPADAVITHIAAYLKKGDTRYVVVLEDETIWWYMPNHKWQASPIEGLPDGYKIKQFSVYLKNGDTRYVVLLEDNSIWWYMPNYPWQNSSIDGLPLPKQAPVEQETPPIDHETVTVIVPADGDLPKSEHVEIPPINLTNIPPPPEFNQFPQFRDPNDTTEIPPNL
jgi:hypothetical protein